MNKPYWQSTKLPRFPKLSKNLTVDVVVVGAGITGVTAAYLLKKAGRSVALLEKDRIAQADTAHTTAHLTQVLDIRLDSLVKSFGRDHARAAWQAGILATETIERLSRENNIDCDFRRVPHYLHAPVGKVSSRERRRLEYESRLAEELGFDVDFVDAVPLFHQPGMRINNQALFHPLKYLAGLVATIPGRKCHVFESTSVDEISDKPLTIKANGREIQCAYVVIATHVPLTGKNSLVGSAIFQSKLASYSTYAVGATLPRGSAPYAGFYDTADPYHYLRIHPIDKGDYAILGGNDHKTGQNTNTDESFADLENKLRAILPKSKISHRWSGQVVETHDGLPFIGEIDERQFIATGYSGNGMTFGTLAAMMAHDAYFKIKNPWSALFDVRRKKISGAWDYIRENADYPWYLIKDFMTATQGDSLRSLKRGQGKILKLNGQRVAAYRNDNGKVTKCSPVCTHLGCLVRWNPAERTWDCPCHGSRFHPNGQLIAGPAEDPLPKID